MKRHLLKVFLLSAMVATSGMMFTSCKDYDDDIDELNGRFDAVQGDIDAIKKDISKLQSDFGSLAYVKDVKWDEATRTLTVTPLVGNPVSYEISDTDTDTHDGNTKYTLEQSQDGNKVTLTLKGDDGSTQQVEFTLPDPGTTVTKDDITVDDEGYICFKGQRTSVKLPEVEIPEIPEAFDPSKVKIENREGKIYLKYGEAEEVELLNLNEFDPQQLTCSTDENGDIVVNYQGKPTGAKFTLPEEVSIVEKEDGSGYIIKVGKGGEGKEVEVVNINILQEEMKALKSLVFIPDAYTNGIESIVVRTIKYKEWNLQDLDVNGDDTPSNGHQGYDTKADRYTTLTPKFAANYHVNPSNVAPDSLSMEKLSFLAKNVKVITKAGELMPTITGSNVKDGVLTVNANMSGNIEDFKEKVSVLALQVTNGDHKVTSDYAALSEDPTEDLVLSLKDADTPDVCNPDNHLDTTITQVINDEKTIKIQYDEEGYDIAEIIQTHKGNGGDHAVVENIGNYGFKYVYDLVGWKSGQNTTSQSAHAILKGSKIRPQLTKDGKQNTDEDAPQGRATIGRMPIVRVSLIDTVTHKDYKNFKPNATKAAAVGYIKFEIVGEEPPADDDYLEYTFKDNKEFTVSCDNKYEKALLWYEIEEQIYTKLGMSKEEFEGKYELDTKETAAKQFVSTGLDAKEKNPYLGKVEITTSDIEGNMTEVLKWTVEDNDVYEYFVNNKNTSAKAIVRFKLKDESVRKHYVYVTFDWTPKPLNINPSVSIDNKCKIDEYWWSLRSEREDGFEEVHVNVAVYKTTPTDDSQCTYEKNLYDYFEGGKFKADVVQPNVYTKFFAGEETYKFEFADLRQENNKIKVEATGNTYSLGHRTGVDGKQYLTATKDLTTTDIVELDPTTGMLVYQDNDVAKEILNAYGRGEYGDGETLAARIKITGVNSCDHPFTVNNGEFEVRFLRPISVAVKENKGLIDAVNQGDNLKLADVLKFYDFRGEDYGTFTKENLLFTHYGVKAINVDVENIKTNMNHHDKFDVNLKDVNEKIDVTFTEAQQLSLDDFGTLNYMNNGGEVGTAFKIRVPVNITYKWGNLIVPVDIDVHETIGK